MEKMGIALVIFGLVEKFSPKSDPISTFVEAVFISFGLMLFVLD